jgi:hypothetical protein
MPINFPSNPANNQVYTFNAQSWYWANNYGTWVANTSITGYTGSIGYTGSLGSTGYTGSSADLGISFAFKSILM